MKFEEIKLSFFCPDYVGLLLFVEFRGKRIVETPRELRRRLTLRGWYVSTGASTSQLGVL